jgi:Tfp pilus assembly protein PilF
MIFIILRIYRKRFNSLIAMKHFYLLLFIVSLTSSSMFSQSQVIFDKEEAQTFLIKYTPGEQSIKNTIFNQIAQANNKPVSSVSLTFTYRLKRQILRRNNILEFIASMSDISITGDKMYKGFDLGDILVPGKVSFSLQWLKAQQVLNTYNFNDISVSGNYVNLVNMTVTDTVFADNYQIRIINYVFDYTQQNKQVFDNQTALVDDYYDENLNARNRLRNLSDYNKDREYLVHMEDLNQIYRYRDTANRALVYVNTVKQKQFYKSLPIHTFDPEGLNNKLNTLTSSGEHLRDLCSDIINNLDRIYYERGIEMLALHKPPKADFYFNKSLEVNPNYAPSHLQLARLYYNSGEVDRAVNKIFEIRGMNPDPETKMQTVELARGIYNDFVLDAAELNNAGRFDDAIAIIIRAKDICTNFPEVKCRPNMDMEMARAVNGKYGAILNDIDIHIRNENLPEAEKIALIALDFGQKNRPFIVTDDAVAARISLMYKKYLQRGENLIVKKDYENAVFELDQAGRMCNGYQLLIQCTDQLQDDYYKARSGMYNNYIALSEQAFRAGDNKEAEKIIENAIGFRNKYVLTQNAKEDKLFLDIKRAIYQNLIDEGRNLTTQGKYTESLNLYDQALNLENNFGFAKNPNLGKYITESAKKLVFDLIANGENKVKLNNLQDARKSYNEAKDVISKYTLESDNAVNQAMVSLKEKIFQKECLNAQNAYNDLIQQAKDLINQKKYIEADKKFEEAVAHSKTYAQCEIDNRELLDKREFIAPAVNYLNKITAVNNYIARKNYKSAVEEYIAAENYHKVQVISNYGITHTKLFDFIQSGYTDFIIYGVGYYNHSKEYDKAIDLLRELSRRQTKSKYTKDIQIVLGTDMATYDYQQNPGGNVNTNLATYTGGNKFFKEFIKAYKKQWSRLQ